MGELTEQEKLERRRQKRQQRILNAGESRLHKITGTAFPHRASPTPSPSVSSEPTTRKVDEDPSEDLGAPQPLFENLMGSNAAATLLGNDTPPFPFNLEQKQGQEQAFNPASLFAAFNAQASEPTVQRDITTSYWNGLHLIMMILLGCYAVYQECKIGRETFSTLLYHAPTFYSNHMSLFWYFVTIELGLQSARMFYHKGSMPSNSTWAQLATQLPHPIGTIATVFMRYRLIFSCLVQDISILIFIVGMAQVILNVL
ncbi:hypothetical protein A0J61_03484 [Choanephora cucurbitarum]|uniref:Golgi to ER traffic protein 2 n=1 Tax=Choanephora cucurbitarum TaxID=101091 RepID=A0A1C7NIX1_9FUNG|nr:hypothetical protein A0J61_03484 [Choanephora cucurbitarum]